MNCIANSDTKQNIVLLSTAELTERQVKQSGVKWEKASSDR